MCVVHASIDTGQKYKGWSGSDSARSDDWTATGSATEEDVFHDGMHVVRGVRFVVAGI